MSENSASVGKVELDLVINNKIQGQLEKAKSGIQKSIGDSLSGALNDAKKVMPDFKNQISQGLKIDKKQITEPVSEAVDDVRKKIGEIGGFKVATDSTERLRQELDNTYEKIAILQNKWEELQNQAGHVDDYTFFDKILPQINSTEKQLISLNGTAEKLQQKIAKSLEVKDPSTDKAAEDFKRLQDEVDKAKEKINSLKEKQSELKNKVKSTSSSVKKCGNHFSTLKKVGSKAADAVKSKMSSLGSSVSKIGNPFTKLFNSIKNGARRIFVMAGILSLLKSIRSALSETANQNEDFAKSLNDIKANLQIAFQPIMSAVMPALNSLMSGLATATKYIAAFTSELFGSTYKKSLEAVKQAKSVAKEVKKAAKSIMGFDEINTLSKSDSSGSGNGNDTDFSKIDSDVKLPNFAERLKDAIKKGDWKEAGSILGEKINGVLNKVYTSINNFDWEKAGRDVAGFFNGGIAKIDWSLAGKTLASGLNAAINSLYGFITEFDFSGFGVALGESINGFIEETDWAKAGQTLSEGIIGILDFAMGLLETIDWQQLGEKVWLFLKSIDWAQITEKLFTLIGETFGALASFLWGFIKEAWEKVVDWWQENAFEDGKFIIEGLLNGMLSVVLNWKQWIIDHIYKPFIDGFKKCFKINSPSKVMEEQGNFIMEGLIGGISAAIGKVKEVFGKVLSAIKGVFSKIGSWFGEKFGEAWEKIKRVFSGAGKFFGGIWQTIKSKFDGLGTKIGDAIGSGFKTAINGALKTVEGGINFIPKALNGALNLINKLPGVNIGKIPTISLPQLAKGGIVSAPTLAMVGEKGKEAVMPLENNTGWIDKLAEKIASVVNPRDSVDNGEIAVYVSFDGATFDDAVVNAVARKSARSGGRI